MRCKFRLDKIEQFHTLAATGQRDSKNGRDIYAPRLMNTLLFNPVAANGDPEHENSKFWVASPQGEFRLQTVNANAVAGLVVGGEYYIDITPAPIAAPAAS